MRFRRVILVVVVGMVLAALASAAESLRVLRITPAGDDVPPGRQIVLEFDRPVVPVGRMERRPEEVPVTITPPLHCSWRWLTTATLACQLGERQALQPATRYAVTMHSGITAGDGATLTSEVSHTFLTQRPKIDGIWLRFWKAPDVPEIMVAFDQPVQEESLAQHLFMRTPQRPRVPVRITPVREQQGRRWLVEPLEALGLDTNVVMLVEPGILPTQGKEPGVEQRTVMTFDTFPALHYLGVSCTTLAEDEVLIRPGTPRSLQPACHPLRPVALAFSAPVLKDAVKNVLAMTPEPARIDPQEDPWDNVYSPSYRRNLFKQGTIYSVYLPEPFRAYSVYTLTAEAGQITDEFGRVLPEAIATQFLTDHRPPSWYFEHSYSVLEHNVDSHVPITVTNLETLQLSYDILTPQGRRANQQHMEALPKAVDIPYAYPIKVRELLGTSSGAIQGTIASTPMGESEPAWFFSQVTPFDVHVKLGHYNTLVWVTRFDTGLPVAGAQIHITRERLRALPEAPPVLAESITAADGVAMLPGASSLDPQLIRLNPWENEPECCLFVRVQHTGDMALVPLVPEFWVEVSGTNDQSVDEDLQERYAHIHTWGTTPQGVYRAGDTVDFKIYVRDQDNQRFRAAPTGLYGLRVFDPTDKLVYEEKDIQLSAFGGHHGSFPVPETAAVGWYRFELSANFTEVTWQPMRVLISDFTPASFRVTTDLNGTLFKPGDTVTVTTQASLHAGGPYGKAATSITATVERTPLEAQDPQAAGFFFAVVREEPDDTIEAEAEAETEDAEESGEQAEGSAATEEPSEEGAAVEALPEAGIEFETVHEAQGEVNDQGILETTFEFPAIQIIYGNFRLESAVKDDRGKSVAGYATARYVGRDRFVGLLQRDWLLAAHTPAEVQAVVIDEHGKIAADTPIVVIVQQLQTRAAQVKGAGNAYVTQYEHFWVNVETCQFAPAAMPQGCSFTPAGAGTYRFLASISDTQGRPHRSYLRRWATGAGDVVWETAPGYNLAIFPEKPLYRIGETARFLIHNPFPGAQALLTVERFGVQKHWVETFPESTAVVELPLTPDHLPGLYFSAMVLSPRVDKPLGDGQVDLGKPAFRMGYVRIPIHDPAKQFQVEVKSQQEVYKPGQMATVHLQVRTAQGDPPPRPVELAVAVLDEAVFDLIARGRDYFDPYKGFYTLDSLDLRNYNLLLQLIGRQKFEKKGANPGGDGGLGIDLRSVFKFVSYWNPALLPDAQGQATITFALPDNLTGWRVLAMAATADDLMGLGEGHFKANKPTEIRPALPNQVTEGDRFAARFVVMNRTDTARTLEVTLNAAGSIAPLEATRQTIQAEPFQRYPVSLPLQVTGPGRITLTARAGDSQDQDALSLPLTVYRKQALEVAATFGTTTDTSVTIPFAFPANMRTDVGEVSVVATPTVLGDLEGAFVYMRDYPYACWEQVLTKGVMAAHYQALRAYLPGSLQWPESADLPARTLARAANHQVSSGGMTFYVPKEEYVSPALSAYTALAFNWLRASGYTIPAPVEAPLHDYLLNVLRQDAVPDFYSQGMRATVRAMALAALAPHAKVSRTDLERFQPHVPQMSLFGKAHFLLAATSIADSKRIQDEVATAIRAHGDESTGTLVFSEALDTAFQRILESSMRTNCAVLSALLAYEGAQGRDAIGRDIAVKLVRTITQHRKRQHRWENTQENMFCMQALLDFSRRYEQEAPQMTLQALFDQQSLGKTTFQAFTDAAAEFHRPLQHGDAGRTATLTLNREGQGRVYYTTRLAYSPETLKSEPINAGIEVQRQYSVERNGTWELLHSPMEIHSGELVRVDLYLSLPAARTFVVVDDPVPGGLEPVNRDLATASEAAVRKAASYAEGSFWWRFQNWILYGSSRWGFYHRELRHRAARFYSEYVPAGHYHLSYVAQAIAPGEFTVLPVHVEEMYNPETFGQGVPAVLRVQSAASTP